MSKPMALALELAETVAPREALPALRTLALHVQATYSYDRALPRFLRIIQDGLDFGKWPH